MRTDQAAGFSLMEVLVSVAVLGVVYTVLFGLMSGSLRNVDRVGEREKILRSAQMKLNELVLAVNQGDGSPPSSGRFDEKYTWQARIEDFDLAENAVKPPEHMVARIRLQVNWQGNSGPQVYELQTMTWAPRR
ncbi:MAG: type II secretion system protein [Acidobacteriota bacterium]